MLTINLLPVKQLKKRAAAINQLIVAGLAISIIIVALVSAGYVQSSIKKGVQSDIATLNAKKKAKAAILAQIKQLEKKRIELDRKIGVIKKLKKGSALAVRIMDEVANRIDPDRMWLTSFTQSGSSLSMQGVALDNKSIADFMEKLEESSYIYTLKKNDKGKVEKAKDNVRLQDSKLKKLSGKNLTSFSIRTTVHMPQQMKTTQPSKGNK